jgi:hypothetical protein
MTKIEEGPSKGRPETPPPDRPDDGRDEAPPAPPQRSSVLDSAYRFLALYLTTLFSLDAYAAAANSPHRALLGAVPPRQPPPQRPPGDFGEGAGVGMRLDPGGPQARRGGMPGAPAGINIPVCGTCTMPSVS